jgi:hypothetical protein
MEFDPHSFANKIGEIFLSIERKMGCSRCAFINLAAPHTHPKLSFYRKKDFTDLLTKRMGVEPPTFIRQPSIGVASFADRLAEGQADAGDELMHPAYGADEEEPDFLSGHEENLQPAPQETQMVDDDGGEDDRDDDRQLELVPEKFESLNAKYCRIKDLMAKKQVHETKAGPDPYELMENMHDGIDAMEEGSAKKDSVKMYNAIFAIYESGRSNPDLLAFVADLFPAQRDYYKDKEEKRAINAELKMLTKLYDEQEMAVAMKQLEQKQKQRKAALQSKAAAKATKLAAKEEKPAKKAKSY